MDMQNAVESAMAKLVSSGKIEEMIEKRLEDTVRGLIDESLKGWSDFGKELKAKIEAAVKINLKEFSLPEYNVVIGNQIIKVIQDTLYPTALAQIEEAMRKFLKPLEKGSYTLAEIVGLYKESTKEWDDPEPESRFTARIDESHGFIYLGIDEEPNKERYRCKYRIGIRDGKIFSLHIDGDNAIKTRNPGYHGFGDTLFKMYASGVTITDDGTDVADLAYFDSEYD